MVSTIKIALTLLLWTLSPAILSPSQACNPNPTSLNPNLSTQTCLNLTRTCHNLTRPVNPNLSQLNPDLSQLNPECQPRLFSLFAPSITSLASSESAGILRDKRMSTAVNVRMDDDTISTKSGFRPSPRNQTAASRSTKIRPQKPGGSRDVAGAGRTGNFLLIYICNFHVLSNLLLIYICKLHWNLGGTAPARLIQKPRPQNVKLFRMTGNPNPSQLNPNPSLRRARNSRKLLSPRDYFNHKKKIFF